MRNLSDIFGKTSTWTHLLFLAILSLGTAASAAGTDCSATTRMELNTDLRGFGLERTEIFEIDVYDRGILALEATVPVGAAAAPKLALLGDGCRPVTTASQGVMERYITGRVLEISVPGTYRFAVAPQAPRTGNGQEGPDASLEIYRISTRFTSWSDLCGKSPTEWKTLVEPEPDPDLATVCLTKTLVEPEPDPDLAKTLVEPEPDPDLLEVTAKHLCSAAERDDHGDLFACATRIGSNARVRGRLSNTWGDDIDVFRLTLPRQETLTMAVTTEEDVSLELYDGNGHRLDVPRRAGETAATVTLAGGSYYLRLGNGTGAEADYGLRITSSGW